MISRPFGDTGMTVSALGLGGSTFGGGLQFHDQKEIRRIIEAACDAGVTFFDTSPSYGGGASETVMGRALSDRRDKVVIATKGGVTMSRWGALAIRLRPFMRPVRSALSHVPRRKLNVMRARHTHYSYEPAEMRRQLEDSLRRLRTEYVDLYQFYNVTETALQRDDLFEVMSRFKDEGKIRTAGVTVVFPDPLFQAVRMEGVDAIQLPVSLLDREAGLDVLPAAAARGIGVIARSPLAQGFLTEEDGHVMGYETAHAPLARLQQRAAYGKKLRVLTREGRTMAQTALRFVLQLQGVSTVIFSVDSETKLVENLGALDSPPLSAEELASIDELAPASACSLASSGDLAHA